ncbi:MAG: AbrB/MazE/SpoVT family DNA-binding domain-containing protein [Thermomicrobiales bacterium]
MLSTKITREGQITIPVEIRNELDLREGDVLVVEHHDGKIVMTNRQEIVRRTAGALAKYARFPPLRKR